MTNVSSVDPQVQRAFGICEGNLTRFAVSLPALPKVEVPCFYCHKTISIYQGMPFQPDDILERQMRTGVTEAIATCGSVECSRKDLLRQDTMFTLIQREKERHAAAEPKPRSVDPNSVQGKGTKARVRKGQPVGSTPIPGVVEPVAGPEGHDSERSLDCPFE